MRTPCIIFAAAALALPMGGCNIIGPVAYFIHGPEKAQAQFELPPDRSAVVFIDDRASALPRRSLRQKIAESAQKALTENGGAGRIIDYRAAVQATSLERSETPMNIAELGRAVQAEMVIYAVVDSFTVTPDGSSVAPVLALRVKVIDVMSEERLWPDEKEGHPITVASRPKQGFTPQNASDVSKLEDDAARLAGLALAQVFYTHEVMESAGRQ